MADHKQTNPTDTTLMQERVKSVAAIIAALYFVANTILGSFGVNPLPFTNEEIANAVSSVGAVVMTLIVWWRQNVITKAANEGHQLTLSIKPPVRCPTTSTPCPSNRWPTSNPTRKRVNDAQPHHTRRPDDPLVP